jgi:hypothetical protein
VKRYLNYSVKVTKISKFAFENNKRQDNYSINFIYVDSVNWLIVFLLVALNLLQTEGTNIIL